jgi:hypothetical protein
MLPLSRTRSKIKSVAKVTSNQAGTLTATPKQAKPLKGHTKN